MNPGFGYETHFPAQPNDGFSFISSVVPLFIFIIFIIFIGSIIYKVFYKGASTAYHQKASLKEQESRPYETDISFKVDQINRRKIGYPEDFSSFDNHCLLVKEQEGILHFNYDNSPQIQLTNVEFRPKYGYHTNSSNDNFGTSTPYEIPNDGILTFKSLDDNRRFMIKAELKESLYVRLKTEFLTF